VYNNLKQAAILSPRQKQGTLQSRLARIDELLADRARYEALIRQAPATRPAANGRTRGKSQQQYSKTRCDNCWSTLVIVGDSDLVCCVCKAVSPRLG
jgi:hypothetical protein